jgi:DNA invertase Pin-like site-specific DNA recombinase
MARYGYILIDNYDDDIGRQALQLDTIGDFARIFVERQPGDSQTRAQRKRLISQLQSGDIVYAAAADRFCNNLKDFLAAYGEIAAAGAELVLLEEALDSRAAAGKQALKILTSFEKLNYHYQSERKKAGIRQAKAEGRRVGRPPVSIPPGFREICRRWSAGEISGKEAMAQSGLRSTSFYKKAAEMGFKPPVRKKQKTSQ